MPKHKNNGADKQSRIAESMRRLDAPLSKTAGSSFRNISPKPNEPLSVGMFADRYSFDEQFPDSINVNDNDEYREYLHAVCRMMYDTHPIVGACIDVYSRFPVTGMSLSCKDESIKKFYEDVFFDTLNYEEHLINMGREYWTVGECFSLADWDDNLKTFIGEDIVDPAMVKVTSVPMTNLHTFEIEPTDEMKHLLRNREPRDAYDMFVERYPDLVESVVRGENITVDQESMGYLARLTRPNDFRGTPILKRALRALQYEERLEDAMKAVADRLLAPLTIFKLGSSDLGDGTAWVPSAAQIDEFSDNIDAALNSDFRALVTHFAVDVQQALSPERLISMKGDRDMLDERVFMTFGLSPDIFKGGGGNTYAAAAVRMELAMQMLSTYQKQLVKHYEKRARRVAEANEFYDYEIINGERHVVEEEYSYFDDESGEVVVEKRPKLLYPELRMRSVNFRDENTEREFLLALRDLGIPIPDSQIMLGIEYDAESSYEQVKDETVKRTLYSIRADKAVVDACIQQNLPIPPDILMRLGIMPPQMSGSPDGEPSGGQPQEPQPEQPQEQPSADVSLDESPDSAAIAGGGGRPNISDAMRSEMPTRG